MVPASLRRRIPEGFKNRLLVSLMLITQRDLSTLRLRRAAEVAGRNGDWAGAVQSWQVLATLLSPLNKQIQDGTLHRALLPHGPPEGNLDALPGPGQDAQVARSLDGTPHDIQRKFRYARTELTRARVHHALDLHRQGRIRAFRENLCRAIEVLPDQRVFKKERFILDAVRLYVQDALTEDRVLPMTRGVPATPPVLARPLKIAICLDVLKLSDVHTHARVVFAICHNLMRLDPRIETHIIVTNERFCVTTPILSSATDPGRAAEMLEQARQALPDTYGKRFFLHVFRNMHLSGVVETCKGILAIDPDVLLFGGGHKGYFSNESRVVRHCLYDHLPVAFFFIQSNNEVDEKTDMIIARGPHPVLGDPGQAKVRIQPYPTITEGTIKTVLRPTGPQQKIIVSAITGVRMDQKMAQQSDSDMRAFFSILDKSPGAVWHFIGASNPKGLIAANRHIARRVETGQVVVHPVLPLPEFSALVGRAALFLHLPGFTGGSGGASVARRAGIPILTFRHSDVSGRQPGETVFEQDDVSGFVARAITLLHDHDAWRRTVLRQFEHTRWIMSTSAQGFYDCLTEAYRIGIQRTAARTDRHISGTPPVMLRPSA